ncbi:MAG TPA: hypothetical protein VFA20_07445 [Myxococcaceae bacterium]|nr:hypothetical protein [Myxococcaceae bacterium]
MAPALTPAQQRFADFKQAQADAAAGGAPLAPRLGTSPVAPPPAAPSPGLTAAQQRFADFKQAQADAAGAPTPRTPAPTPAQQRFAAFKQDQVDALSNGQTVSEYRQVNTLTSQFTADPQKWDATRRALGLPDNAAPTSDNVTSALRLSRSLDAAGQRAGDAAASQREAQLQRELFSNPAVAARAQREIDVSRNTATYRAQLQVLHDSGRLTTPPGVDPAQWMDRQSQLVGAEQRVRGDALARGQDPTQAAQRSSTLYRMQLETSLDSGRFDQPLTPDQRQQIVDRQMQYHSEAVDLSRKLGIPMTDAMDRIQGAHDLTDQRVAGQLQIEAAAQRYDDTTTAATRGIERIRGFFGGDGVYNLDQTRADFSRIEGLQSQYDHLVLDNKTLTPDQQAQRAQLEAQIRQQIDAATGTSTGTIDASTSFANNSRPVEQGLWQTALLASTVIPGGPAIAALAKLGLDDLPNGRIRADTAAHLGQDVGTSLLEGGGAVYLNKLGLGGASPLTMALASAGFSGGTSLLEQARNPSGAPVDLGRVLLDTGIGGLSGGIGASASRLPGLIPGTAGQALQSQTGRFLFDRGVDVLSAAGLSALDQLGTTGTVDRDRALNAGLQNGALGALDSLAQQGLLGRMAPPSPAAAGTPPPAPITTDDPAHAAELLRLTARNAGVYQGQQDLLGPFAASYTATEQQLMRQQVQALADPLRSAGMDPSTPEGRQALRQAWGGGPEADALLSALDRLPTGPMPATLEQAHDAYDQWASQQIARGNFDLQPVTDHYAGQVNEVRDALAQQGFDPAAHPQGGFAPPAVQQPANASDRRDLETQTDQLLGVHARNLEYLQRQQQQLGARAPSYLDVAIRGEQAAIERNRAQLDAIGAQVPPSLQPALQGVPRGVAAFSPWDPELIGPRVAGATDPEQAAQDLMRMELNRQHLSYYQGLPALIAGMPPSAPVPSSPVPRTPMSRQLGLPVGATPASTLNTQAAQLQQEVRNLLRLANLAP